MIVLNKFFSDSVDFDLLGLELDTEELNKLTLKATALLRSRGFQEAAKILQATPFKIWRATNLNGDDFFVLFTNVGLEKYEYFRKNSGKMLDNKSPFSPMAEVLTELGPYIHLIACELEIDKPPKGPNKGLSNGDIFKLVNRYIGVSGGYLGDFNYRTHAEFYPEYCGLEINPNEYQGTTRERFIEILKGNGAVDQAKIIYGILKKYPFNSEPHRTKENWGYFNSVATKLEGLSVPKPNLGITNQNLSELLQDAEILIKERGAQSAVDRVHTAFQAYLLAICEEEGISHESDQSLTDLFKLLRQKHPAFASFQGPRAEEIRKILRGFASIIDSLSPLRNRASAAHPNKALLDEHEAKLVVNVVRTLFQYLDSKLA